ncbi:hypothetical protein Q8791_07085 [Nocardiopsis sp. CT-R113]|uniref:Uncharacterized protein n=1 Tax=Nocardiopsis codii TaxID=3065942 RepID=A0ABU7K409_9ACTN|nr:hypothetical protein [Nocardiopsis sp. CT-R113]MEE2036981.1 hypothetical protein [Nocardiopsis sp. CT-R113]
MTWGTSSTCTFPAPIPAIWLVRSSAWTRPGLETRSGSVRSRSSSEKRAWSGIWSRAPGSARTGCGMRLATTSP